MVDAGHVGVGAENEDSREDDIVAELLQVLHRTPCKRCMLTGKALYPYCEALYPDCEALYPYFKMLHPY